MIKLCDTDPSSLESLLGGHPGYRKTQVLEGVYRSHRLPAELTTLPRELRSRLAAEIQPALTLVAESAAGSDDTVKWLFALEDGQRIETVLMRYPDRVTACVSTQAGCAMGCSFCATGQGGFGRNLSAAEILEQIFWAERAAKPRAVTHVVFMGMGEPLANYDRTVAAARRLRSDFGISLRRLTISTVGIIPGIRRLAAEKMPVTLAVSLHAANDELRNELVPMNRRYPIADLVEACSDYARATSRRISFEWALISGVNDRARDAEELAALATTLGAHINLIPLNPTPGYPVIGTAPPEVASFASHLRRLGANATVRDTRGREIAAACGQLSMREAGGGRPARVSARSIPAGG